MRDLRLIVILVACGGILSCDGEGDDAAPDDSAAAVVNPPPDADSAYDREAELQRELEQTIRDQLADLDLRLKALRDPPFESRRQFELEVPFDLEAPRGGGWLNCRGYLTNNATAGFCEGEPPANWRPFIFDGQRYFVVPLGPSA